MGCNVTLYKGYSSHEYQKNKTFNLTDKQLVNMDLLNHIYTLRGSRVMMPTFGTRIPLMAFEPLDDITMGIVEDDLRMVVAFDPRVNLQYITLTPSYETNSLVVELVVDYIELKMSGSINLNIIFGEF